MYIFVISISVNIDYTDTTVETNVPLGMTH